MERSAPFLALAALTALSGCDGTRAAALELELESCVGRAECAEALRGVGLFVAQGSAGDDQGAVVFYGEVSTSSSAQAIIEIALRDGVARRVRYREVREGRVSFRGSIVEHAIDRLDPALVREWRFSFTAWDKERGLERRVRNAKVTPVEGVVGAPPHGSAEGGGCGGGDALEGPRPEPSVPRGPVPRVPEVEEGPTDLPSSLPDPGPARPSPGPPSREPTVENEVEVRSDDPRGGSGSSCEGDASSSGCSDCGGESTSSGGCEGDTSSGGCEGDTSSGGCESDTSSGGCEGDTSSSGCDCEGDVAAGAAVFPLRRALGSTLRLFWPAGLVAWVNRRLAHRRPHM